VDLGKSLSINPPFHRVASTPSSAPKTTSASEDFFYADFVSHMLSKRMNRKKKRGGQEKIGRNKESDENEEEQKTKQYYFNSMRL
jgi:hypothetical protein